VQHPSELLRALTGRERPFVILIDALDEATDPSALTRDLLRPLADSAEQYPLRLLLGTRRHLLKALGAKIVLVDLDDPDTYLDQEAVQGTVRRGLCELDPTSPYRNAPHSLIDQVATTVARAAGRSFLVARITTRILATNPTLADPDDAVWRRGLPTTAGEAMRQDLAQRLGVQVQRARDLLAPLAYAEGAGLPWEDFWAPLATQLAHQRDPTLSFTNQDLEWLREHAGSYVIEAAEQGRSAYRLYHQALADHLRHALPATQANRLVAQFLIAHTPTGADDAKDWPRAHPYTRRHLATHAANADDPKLLDRLLCDPGFLLVADPGRLLAASDHATSPDAKAAAVAYQHTVHHLRGNPPSEHAAYLELVAHCYHAVALAERIRQANPARPWATRWTRWNPQAARITFTGHTGGVSGVAVAELDGRPIAISGSDDRTVRVWDLASGRPIDPPLTGHTSRVSAVAELEGSPIAISVSGGYYESTVRVWDLASGRPIGRPLPGDTFELNAVAVGKLEGRPIAVSGGYYGTVRVWDLASGRPIDLPLTDHTSRVRAVAVGELDGRPIAISGSDDRTVRVWDLASGRSIGRPPTGHTSRVRAVAVGERNGRPIVVSVSGHDESTVRVWDPASRSSIDHFIGRTVRVWDLASGRPIGRPLTGHTGWVNAVAVGQLEGRPIAVSGGDDGTVRVWDLASGRPIGLPLTGYTYRVRALAVALGELEGRPIAVSGGHDGTVRVWDVAGGRPIGPPLTGHSDSVTAVAVAELDGRLIAVSGGHDGTVRVWDLTSLRSPLVRVRRRLRLQRDSARVLATHTEPVTSVACGEVTGTHLVASGGGDQVVRLSGPVCKFVRGGHAARAGWSCSSKRRSSRSRSDRVKCQSNGTAVCS
jgi:WD40 repeat protein